MKIALINEASQAAKNSLVFEVLQNTVAPLGHQAYNYGMLGAEDPAELTYVQNGILACLLLNSGAADFVVTGCGTGIGAMLALNSFAGVTCGFAADPADAFLFRQINNGNAISLPFAKGFGWGAELNLAYLFEKLFGCEGGAGYPPERVAPQQANAKVLAAVRANNLAAPLESLGGLDKGLVKGAFAGKAFEENFFANCQRAEYADFVRSL